MRDLAEAWERSVSRTRQATHLSLPSPNARVESLGGWLFDTEGGVGNISMPEHAQRVLSATVVALQVHEFEQRLRADTHWDSMRRVLNWI
eukprot:COSAG02_NODE_1856_length_10648_cov_8.834581_8_plen_90_part_00